MNLGDRVFDWLGDHILPWLMILAIGVLVVIIGVVPFAIYNDYKAEKFSLRKDEWVCSASIQTPSTTYIQTGNVMVPITNYSTHCTQWTEKK